MDRDPFPVFPDCPVCESNDAVKRHDNPHQGRWFATCCMVLFDGTSAEWVKPERVPHDVSREVEEARTVLREAVDHGA